MHASAVDGSGGGDVELAQPLPGPISVNYDAPEREPLTWTDIAMLCVFAVFSAGSVAGGIVVIMVRAALGPDGVPVMPETASIVFGSIFIVLGLVSMPLAVALVITMLRRGRQVKAMTRLHVVPVVSRR